MIGYILTDTTLSVIVDGKVHQVARSHPNWEAIKAELNSDTPDEQQLVRLMDIQNTVRDATAGTGVVVKEGVLYYNDQAVHSTLSARVLDILKENLDIDPWIKFTEKVYANPSEYARSELYDWLERAELPITKDGDFIAYKKVRDDYRDIYTGKFDNSPGVTVSMPRSSVDSNRDNTCSSGLHFCSKEYLPQFGTGPGSRVVLVKINPADVVSIPSDYSHTKGRTWRYEVIGEIPFEEAMNRQWSAVYDDDLYDDGDDDANPLDVEALALLETVDKLADDFHKIMSDKDMDPNLRNKKGIELHRKVDRARNDLNRLTPTKIEEVRTRLSNLARSLLKEIYDDGDDLYDDGDDLYDDDDDLYGEPPDDLYDDGDDLCDDDDVCDDDDDVCDDDDDVLETPKLERLLSEPTVFDAEVDDSTVKNDTTTDPKGKSYIQWPWKRK